MNVFQSIADTRDERAQQEAEADDRWLRERGGIDPEERRASFYRWVRGLLLKTFTWPTDDARREKLLGQCASELTIMVRQLRGRGWLLDGETLAGEVKACLTPIGAYQRAGKIDDFWPYFRAGVRRYVEANADRIQAVARSTRADEATQTMADVMAGLGLDRIARPAPVSMTELVNDHAAVIVATKAKRGRPRKTTTDQTLPLL